MEVLQSLRKQSVLLPKPDLTEANLPDQTGRVAIITGGYAGVGYQLSKIVYSKNGTVYIAGRSIEKAEKAINEIKAAVPNSTGKLEFLNVDLSDLSTIKPGVESFKSKESKLHVLINNAGVMFPPAGSLDKHSHELQIGTNCLGPFLLTQLLQPLLAQTAKDEPACTVRVAWAGSLAVDILSPKGGITFDKDGNVVPKSQFTNYGMSKTGNYFLSAEFARRYPLPADGKGIISTCFNPGNLSTELQRHTPGWQRIFLNPALYPAIYGAYTELWCGWSPEVTAEKNGIFVWPWGRPASVRSDVARQIGSGGNAEKFWKYCEKETAPYM